MIIALLVLLLSIFVLPFVCKPVERNLEIFLFIVGVVGAFVSGAMGSALFQKIFENELMYFITAAVLVAGIAFKFLRVPLKHTVERIVNRIPLRLFVFAVIVVLGIASSVITAIIAALILAEIVNTIPIDRKKKIQLTIIACFSIGVGAVLTPIGEPLSTIVASRLNVGFFYFLQEFSVFILPCIAVLGLLGAFMSPKTVEECTTCDTPDELALEQSAEQEIESDESYKCIFIRTVKIFLFIIALELLGESFKPIIDTYVVGINGQLLFWGNSVSSIMDNATLAAAEISVKMSQTQIRAVLMGLLISGGMLIPGNIPNIVSAGILKIKSKEWARLGVPLGLALMLVYYVLLFFVL
jgi:predicted cation transporter